MNSKHFEKLLAGLNLDAHEIDAVFGEQYENTEEIWVVPNIEDVVKRLNKSVILQKGTNWIAVKLEYGTEAGDEQDEIFNFLDEKYTVPCVAQNITIDNYRQ